MSIVLEDSIFILPEKLNINNTDTIKQELITFIEKNNIVTLDGCIVEEIDAFGLQIILSAHKLCYIKSKPFSIIEVSNPFRKVLELTGFLELVENE